MDEYDIKFAKMQKHIPFLEMMIDRLQKMKNKSREGQLKKIRQLHRILTSTKRHRLEMVVLQKCELALQKLYKKMGKRTNAGVNCADRGIQKHFPSRSDVSTSINHKKSRKFTESPKMTTWKKIDENLARSSSSASPDVTSKSIAIRFNMTSPERMNDYSDKTESKLASFNGSAREVTEESIIIPTLRRDTWVDKSQQKSIPYNSSKIDSSGTHRMNDTKSHSRPISLAASSPSSLKRISSDKHKDYRHLSLESHEIPEQNITSLLASPSSESSASSFSMEDLAELLDENTQFDEITTSRREIDNRNRFVEEKIQEETNKSGNERKMNKNSMHDYTNIDVESERRWEQKDKQMQLVTRKSSSLAAATSATTARTEIPEVDSKSSSSLSIFTSKRNSRDIKNIPVLLYTENSEYNDESRYTDNHERHLHHFRQPQSDNQNITVPDINVLKSAISNLSEGDIANLVQINLQIQTNNYLQSDDINSKFQRRTDQHQQRPRPSQIGTHESEFRRDYSKLYDTYPQTSTHHSPGVVGHPTNDKWVLNSNSSSYMHESELSPRQYQHTINVPRQDMWDMARNSAPLDSHSHHNIPNHERPVPNRDMRSSTSSLIDRPYTKDMSLSISPPLSSALIPSSGASSMFMNPQYHGFISENQSFQRTGEFQHGQTRQQKDHQSNLGNDATFGWSGEYAHIPSRQSKWEPSMNRLSEGLHDRSTKCHQQDYSSRPDQWGHKSDYSESSRMRGLNDHSYSRISNVEPSLWGCNSCPNTSNNKDERDRDNVCFSNQNNKSSESNCTNSSRLWPNKWGPLPLVDLPKCHKDRDSQCSTELVTKKSTNESSASISSRDPRLLKDIPAQLSIVVDAKERSTSVPRMKLKDSFTICSRDPRRKNIDIKDSHKTKKSSISSHRTRSRSLDRSKDSTKYSSERMEKESIDHNFRIEKPTKDVESTRSSLESLDGDINTTDITEGRYKLQEVTTSKIPLIKPILSRPPTPPKSRKHAAKEEECATEPSVPPASLKVNSSNKNDPNYDKKKEITKTTEKTSDTTILASTTREDHDPNSLEVVATNKELPVQSFGNKKVDDISDISKTSVDKSILTKNFEPGIDASQEAQLKESVTHELIEALIKKSLESGQIKKLFEKAKVLQQLTDPKKYKKIEKIINEDSDSDSFDEKVSTIKKVMRKRKRAAIPSDSSDEECLADRLGITKKKSSKKKAVTNEIIHNDEDIGKNEIEQRNVDDEDWTMTKAKNTLAKKQKKTGKSSKSVEELEKSKEVPPKSLKKTPKKRRNALEMLQEDIREMFISEGVVTATGYRMCRLMKKADGQLSSITSDRKVGVSSMNGSSSRKGQSDMQTDKESSSKVSTRIRARMNKTSGEEGSPKYELRLRKRRKCPNKVTKPVIWSSENESSRTNTTSDATVDDNNTSVGSMKNSDLNQTSSLPDVCDGCDPALNGSKKVVMKELRVLLERVDLSKINLFNISQHSERQSANGRIDSNTRSSKKISDEAIKSQMNSNELSNSGRDALSSVDDNISITSDISILSENNKVVSTSSLVETKKKLIGDILGSSSDEKVKETVNTISEELSTIEGDREKDVSITDNIKLPQLQIDRKNCKWQMSFGPQCKKNKTSNNSSITEISILTSDKNIRNSLGDSNEIKEASVVPKTVTKLNSNEINVENSDTEKLKSSLKSVTNDSMKINDEKESPALKSGKKAIEIYDSLDLNEVIQYAWMGQKEYKCLFCQFSGNDIVNHYKINHPGEEIMISRLTMLDTKRAIEETKDETLIEILKKVNRGPRRKFMCRFCLFTNKGVKKSAMESFYEHCTTHTGEYRFSCKICSFQTISRASIKSHYNKICRESGKNLADAIAEDAIPDDQFISGYLCSVCNYIQLKENNVKMHVETMHRHSSDIEIIKINMSAYFNIKYYEKMNHPFDGGILLNIESDVNIDKEAAVNSKIQDNEKGDDDSDIEILETITKNVNVPPKLDESASKSMHNHENKSLSNKLYALVSPSKLKDKEVEIESERKKKMQSNVNNMVRSFQKPSSIEGLSSTDESKNKMTTDMNNSKTASIEVGYNKELSSIQNTSKLSKLPVDRMNQPSHHFEKHDKVLKFRLINRDPSLALISKCGKFTDQVSKRVDKNSDKIEKKMKDPSTSIQNDQQKDKDVEHKGSDNEQAASVSKSYKSDFSKKITDTELSTDAHSLREAKGTSTISIKNIPTMPNIQFAKQLQSTKTFTAVNNFNINRGTNQESQEITGKKVSQNVVVNSPINSMYSNIIDTRNKPSTSITTSPVKVQAEHSPKNYIRLRRLSGDKLSVLKPSLGSDSSTAENSPPRINKNSSESSTKIVPTSLKNDCSPLKIENVVSLKPITVNTSNASSIPNNMRATLTASTGKTTILLLKKIKPVESAGGLHGRLPPIAPAPPKCIKLSNISSKKILKL